MTGILNALIAGVSGAVKDTYFNLVSLLLPGNGTDGKQNRTFKDSSVNDFLITPNGNTTQGTFSPFSQTGWGNYFDGSSAYLNGDGSAGLALSTGDFTIEFWAFVNSTSGNPQFISFNPASTNGAYPLIRLNTGALEYYVNDTSVITGGSLSIGVWNHIALSRSGTSTKMFLNGTQTGSTYTDTNNYLVGTSRPTIGRAGFSAVGYLNGYISNLRVVKGRAVYTTTFTPPISPLGLTSGGVNPPQGSETKLLTCQSNRFVDAAGTTITVNGSPSVTPFSPFAPTAAYSAAVGGSGYFDGNNDYLTWTGTAAGSGAFSYEFWIYSTNGFGTFRAPLGVIATSGYNSALDCRMSGTTITAGQYNVANNNFTVESLQANTWYHVVICRNASNQMTVFLNGQRSSTGALTISTNFSGLTSAIGRLDPSNGGDVTGYITNVRLITGSTPYDPTQTTITVPTAPLTAITNTQLLLNFTNAGVVDATAKNVLETVGNAQISTTQSKWGGGSVYFDGLNSYLLGASSQQYEFGSGDFTIEAWVNISAAPGDGGIITKGLTGTIDTKIWSLEFVGSGTYPNAAGWYVNAASASFIITGTTNLKTSTWTHVAVCKSGNNTRLFVNGTQEGSTYTTGYTIASGGSLYVGTSFYAPTTRDITGYMDDLRITKFARYTNNFTPPSAPFSLQ